MSRAASKAELALAEKYRRITNSNPVGLLDTVHILVGPDMIDLLLDVIDAQKPCEGKNANICVAEGCFTERDCLRLQHG